MFPDGAPTLRRDQARRLELGAEEYGKSYIAFVDTVFIYELWPIDSPAASATATP